MSAPENEELRGLAPGSLEARASLVLKAVALVTGFAVVLALNPALEPMSWLQAVTFSVARAVVAVLGLVVARGIDRRRSWAMATARPLLLVILVAGIGELVVAIAAGRGRLPYDVVLAGWALIGRPDPWSRPKPDARTVSVTALAALLLVIPLTGASIFGWGGRLDVGAGDLHSAIHVDCGGPGSGPPSTLTASYEWSWRTGSPFPSGTDVVVIGWTGDDLQGRPLYGLGATPPTATGVTFGLQEAPSLTMAQQVEGEAESSAHWGIVLETQGLEPGRIDLELRRTRADQPGPGPLTITATYVHLGVWRQAAPSVVCQF